MKIYTKYHKNIDKVSKNFILTIKRIHTKYQKIID